VTSLEILQVGVTGARIHLARLLIYDQDN